MKYTNLKDETLILLITRAESPALTELYRRYNRLVFSLALNMVGDHATAEEITLDVFTRVWEKAETYRAEQARVNTWLTSITRHRSIDILRRRGSRPEWDSVSWADVSPGDLPAVEEPHALASLSIQKGRVRAAIAQLPKEQQQALALAYFKGYTHRQIAESLDQPLGTIKTRIRLGIKKLRQMLQDE